MEDGTALELINSLRTTAFSSNSRKELLDGLDLVESMLREQERQRTAYHLQLAEREQKITEQNKKIEDLHARTRIAEEKLSLLEEQIRLENARRFGRSSERWTPDETIQAQLFNELEMTVACDTVAPSEEAGIPETRPQKKNRARQTERVGGGRKPLPANLRRQEIALALPDSEKICR
jgi:uncharacterized protein YhaN